MDELLICKAKIEVVLSILKDIIKDKGIEKNLDYGDFSAIAASYDNLTDTHANIEEQLEGQD